MHTKSELEGMTPEQLVELGLSIGAQMSNDKTELIYNIIDRESTMPSEAQPEKPKRGRPKKAEKAADEAKGKNKKDKDKEEKAEEPKVEEDKPKRGRPKKDANDNVKENEKPNDNAKAAQLDLDLSATEAKAEEPKTKQAEQPEKPKRGRKKANDSVDNNEGIRTKAKEENKTDEKKEEPDFIILRDIPTIKVKSESQKVKESNSPAPSEATPTKAKQHLISRYDFEEKIQGEGVLEVITTIWHRPMTFMFHNKW